MKFVTIISLALLLLACGVDKPVSILTEMPDGVQGISLFGDTLYTEVLSEQAMKRFTDELADAEYDLYTDSHMVSPHVWVGRWTAYLGEFREAIDIYTNAIHKFSDEPRLYRHRGHRLISIREFDLAITDLEHAVTLIAGKEDKVEPDGLPNARNIPVSSLHSNIWYHLGLAYYLKGDMENALRAYQECRKTSNNNDNIVSSTHWLYMINRRLGREAEAAELLIPITSDMDVIENQSYHNLLMFYKGELTREDIVGGHDEESSAGAAVWYGLGNWYYYNGDLDEAKSIYTQMTSKDGWASFGYLSAEADLFRMQ